MPIKVMILGLPRTGTTWLYKRLCLRLKDVGNWVCIFEPTNNEVMTHIVKGIKHVHDTEGDVPYDYDRLPQDLIGLIHENSKWHREWSESPKPGRPFCGEALHLILNTLDVLAPNVLVKDVHAWVYAQELTERFRHVKFILTNPDLNTFIERMLKRYRTVKNPLDKAGIGKFLRYFTRGMYVLKDGEDAVRIEATAVWSIYQVILWNIKDRNNVRILNFSDRIPDTEVHNLIRWVLSG